LRETFGSQYLLSYAGYCMDKQSTTGGYRYIDIAASLPYVDYINIMTYDLSVSGGNFHSALEGATSAAYTCKGAVAAYAKVGAPYSKLLLGIPFYGRKDWGSALTYKTIVNLDKSVYNIDNWSTAQSVPYVTRVSNGEVLWGYDNPRSIAIKGSWAMGLGMRGLFSWECSQDDDNESLTKALYNAVMKK
jgi:chitinase